MSTRTSTLFPYTTHFLSLTATLHDKAVEYDGDPSIGVDHDLEWDYSSSVRTLTGGRLTLHFQSHRRLEIDLRTLPPRVYLQGGGYGVDQGNWKGEYHQEHEVWDLDDPRRLKSYIKDTSDHMFQAQCRGEVGYGIMERTEGNTAELQSLMRIS